MDVSITNCIFLRIIYMISITMLSLCFSDFAVAAMISDSFQNTKDKVTLVEPAMPVFDNEANIAGRDTNLRKIYAFLGTGVLEYISLGMGYQLSEHWSLALKVNGAFLSSRLTLHGGNGVGTKITYAFSPSSTFNVLHVEPAFLFSVPSYEKNANGSHLDITIGHEELVDGGGNFYWGIGGGFTTYTSGPLLGMISAKMGWNFNFH
jgi:hypothetical protein